MDARMLEIFVAVADEGGFTRAAARLHLVQSSVSASVAALERQLGFRLFERDTRSVLLTGEGRSFLEAARGVVEALRHAQDAAEEIGGGISGSVSVGVLVIPDMLGVARAVAALHTRHPGLQIAVRTATGGSEGLVRDVAAGELDFSFVVLPMPFSPPPVVALELLIQGRYALVCGRGHPWAGRTDDIPMADFEGVDFVEFPPGFSARHGTDEAFGRSPYRRRTHVEVAHLDLITTYIAAGTGIGFVTESVATASDALVPLRCSALQLDWSIAIARRRDRRVSRAAQTFLDVIRENVRDGIEAGLGDAPH